LDEERRNSSRRDNKMKRKKDIVGDVDGEKLRIIVKYGQKKMVTILQDRKYYSMILVRLSRTSTTIVRGSSLVFGA